jgi:ABC-type transporter Mla subunit MlaD
MMRALQQTRPDVSALMTELNAFSDTLRQIQATQESLSMRLEQVSTEAKQQNDAFMSALNKLQQEFQVQPAVEIPSPEEQNQNQDDGDGADTVEVVQ